MVKSRISQWQDLDLIGRFSVSFLQRSQVYRVFILLYRLQRGGLDRTAGY